MGPAYAGESSSTAGRIWKGVLWDTYLTGEGRTSYGVKKQDTAVNMLSVLFFYFLLKKDVFNA